MTRIEPATTVVFTDGQHELIHLFLPLRDDEQAIARVVDAMARDNYRPVKGSQKSWLRVDGELISHARAQQLGLTGPVGPQGYAKRSAFVRA